MLPVGLVLYCHPGSRHIFTNHLDSSLPPSRHCCTSPFWGIKIPCPDCFVCTGHSLSTVNPHTAYPISLSENHDKSAVFPIILSHGEQRTKQSVSQKGIVVPCCRCSVTIRTYDIAAVKQLLGPQDFVSSHTAHHLSSDLDSLYIHSYEFAIRK